MECMGCARSVIVGALACVVPACAFDLAAVVPEPLPRGGVDARADGPLDSGASPPEAAARDGRSDAAIADAPADVSCGVVSQLRSATVGANQNASGQAWQNPGNVTAADGQEASAPIVSPSGTQYLVATGFGFQLPLGASVRGVEVRVKRRTAGASDADDDEIRLVKAWPTTSNANRAQGANWPTVAAVTAFGGPTDTWGEALVASDVNAASFGAVVKARGLSPGTAYVDHVEMLVSYDPCGVGAE